MRQRAIAQSAGNDAGASAVARLEPDDANGVDRTGAAPKVDADAGALNCDAEMGAFDPGANEGAIDCDAQPDKGDFSAGAPFVDQLRPIASHPVFAPALAVWGALLCSGSVLLLDLQALGSSALYVAASIAGAFGTLAGYGAAQLIRRSLSDPGIDHVYRLNRQADRIPLIEPAKDLGTESLDADLAMEADVDEAAEVEQVDHKDLPEERAEPLASVQGGEPEDSAFEKAADAEAPETASLETTPPENASSEAASLEFTPPETAEIDAPATRYHGAEPRAAITLLRQTHPEELSLMQMVERFAAALHDLQKREEDRPITRSQSASASAAERDAEQALAEALKALAMFSEEKLDHEGQQTPGQGSPDTIAATEHELRSALSRLRTMRGAA